MDAGPHELLHQYEAWLRIRYDSRESIDHRLWMAERVLEKWPEPGDVTVENLGSLMEGATTSWTKRTYMTHLRTFFGWLVDNGRIADDPSQQMRSPKQPRSRPKPVTDAELDRVMAAARGNQTAWLLLAMHEGLRAHEIAKIRGEDVQEDFVYVKGKGAVEADIATAPEVWALAQEYPREGWWFPSPAHEGHISGATVTRVTARLFRSVGIKTGSIHRVRHYYATSMLRQDVNIRIVQELMRHSSLETTAAYTAVDEDEKRAAIDAIGQHRRRQSA